MKNHEQLTTLIDAASNDYCLTLICRDIV